MNIFQFTDYKKFTSAWISRQDRQGYGQFKKIAVFLKISAVVVSQIFKGDRDLTLEQAVRLARFLCLLPDERDYFLILVQKSRSGSSELTQVLEEQMQNLRKRAKILKPNVKHTSLKLGDQEVFYSRWYYSAIRLATGIEGCNTRQDIARFLHLDPGVVNSALDFLLNVGLVVDRNGKLGMGPKFTHLDRGSPLLCQVHCNWRIRAMSSLQRETSEALHYSGPMVLSEKLFLQVREQLAAQVKDIVQQVVDDPDTQELYCLNLDWFPIRERS